MSSTLYTIGLGCIIAAIIGGGLKAFGMEIPLIQSRTRQVILGTFGLLITLIALGSEPTPSPATAKKAGDIILGTWKQYNLMPGESNWRYLSTFDVIKNHYGEYSMSPQKQQEGIDIYNSIGISHVTSDGQHWNFDSNWGNGRIGHFAMNRVSDGQFEGNVTSNGQVVGITRWMRVD